jgi:hypothetical protein
MSLSFYSILRGLTGTQFPVLRDGKKMNAMSRKKKEEKAMNSSIYIRTSNDTSDFFFSISIIDMRRKQIAY